MNKINHIVGMVVVIIIIAGVAFYGGMTYKKNSIAVSATSNRVGFQGGNTGNRVGRVGGNGGMNGGGVSGDIISRTDTTMTVKMRDSSSKVVIYSASTPVREITQVDIALDQLQVGKSITVNGTTNSDGSVTAQSIQLRASSTPFGGR